MPNYAELQEENQRLHAENVQLRLLLEQHGIAEAETDRQGAVSVVAAWEENTSVFKRNSAADKTALFRSSFAVIQILPLAISPSP